MAAVSLMFALICPASTTCPEGSSRTTLHSTLMSRVRSNLTNGSAAFFLVMPSKPPLFNTSRCVLPFFFRVAIPCGAYHFFSCRHEQNPVFFYRVTESASPLFFLPCRGIGWRFFCIMQKFTVKTHIIQKKLYCTTINIC